MKNEFLSGAILGAAMVIGFLIGFPIGSIARNSLWAPPVTEIALPPE